MSHSQLAHSHTHTLTPCLLDSLAFFLSSFTLFFLRRPQSRLPQGGWQCVCVCDMVSGIQWGYHSAKTQLKGLPSQLQGEERDATAFVTCHILIGVSNARVIRCMHHSHLPRPATVTHIFPVFHQPSRLRVCGDAETV